MAGYVRINNMYCSPQGAYQLDIIEHASSTYNDLTVAAQICSKSASCNMIWDRYGLGTKFVLCPEGSEVANWGGEILYIKGKRVRS